MMLRQLALVSLSAASLVLASAPISHATETHSHGGFAAGEAGDDHADVRVIEIEMTEGKGTMAFLPKQIDVRKGETVRFKLKNSGALDHEFVLGTVKENRAHAEMMASMPDMVHPDANAARVASGQSSGLVWKFSKQGEFEFACLIPGHYEAGMHGIVVVK